MGFMPFQVPPNNPGGGGGIINPLTALLGILAAAPQAKRTREEQSAQVAAQKAQTERTKAETAAMPVQQDYTRALTGEAVARGQREDAAAQRDVLTFAGTQYQTLGNMLLTNQQMRNDPDMRARMDQVAQQAGLPSPYNADGTFNESIFLKPISSIGNTPAEENFRNELFAKPPGQARILFARSHGIALTDQEANAVPSYSVKMAQDQQKLTQAGIKIANTDAWQQGRLAVLRDRAAAQDSSDYAKAELARKKVATYDQVVAAQTMRAQAAMRDADARMLSAQAAMKRAQDGIRGGSGGLVARFYAHAVNEVSGLETRVAEADAAVAEAQKNSADDSVTQPLMIKAAALHKGLDEAKSHLRTLGADVEHNTAYSQGVRTSSGSSSTTITTKGQSRNVSPGPGFKLQQQGNQFRWYNASTGAAIPAE